MHGCHLHYSNNTHAVQSGDTCGKQELTTAEACSQVGSYGGQAVQCLHDIIQGRCCIAIQLPLGLQELVYSLQPDTMWTVTAML